MNQKIFDPDKIINYNKDYYAILSIERGTIPDGATKKDRTEVAEILARAYKRCAMLTHPDMPGGSAEAFKEVVQAHTVLSDPILRKIYDSNGEYRPLSAGDGNIQVDWSNFGTYRKGTTADTVGYLLFLQICKRKEELGLIPAFHPIDDFDSYEWDFVIDKAPESDRAWKLAVSLVYDENDVLRLTTGNTVENSLPFKIYICIPRSSLYFLRGEEEKIVHGDGTVDILNGKLQAATYADFNFLETTSLDEAKEYLDEQLLSQLDDFRTGKIIEEQKQRDIESNQSTWLNTDKIKQMDVDVLKAILRMKSLKGTYNEDADVFIDNMPTRKKKG